MYLTWSRSAYNSLEGDRDWVWETFFCNLMKHMQGRLDSSSWSDYGYMNEKGQASNGGQMILWRKVWKFFDFWFWFFFDFLIFFFFWLQQIYKLWEVTWVRNAMSEEKRYWRWTSFLIFVSAFTTLRRQRLRGGCQSHCQYYLLSPTERT